METTQSFKKEKGENDRKVFPSYQHRLWVEKGKNFITFLFHHLFLPFLSAISFLFFLRLLCRKHKSEKISFNAFIPFPPNIGSTYFVNQEKRKMKEGGREENLIKVNGVCHKFLARTVFKLNCTRQSPIPKLRTLFLVFRKKIAKMVIVTCH